MDKPDQNRQRVVIIDNRPEVCAALADRLRQSPEIEVVATATTSQQGLHEVLRHRPDVVVLEVKMADGRGLDICREMTTADPGLRVVVLTSFGDQAARQAALAAGASAYLMKDLDTSALLTTITGRAMPAG